MDKKQREDAINEVHVLKAMRHPYIITYKESFMDKKCLCIVMDYADGGDLYTKIANQKKIGKGKPPLIHLSMGSDVQRGPNPGLVRADGARNQAHPRQEDPPSRLEDAEHLHDADQSDQNRRFRHRSRSLAHL